MSTERELIDRLDLDLQALFKMFERVCREAHLDDEDIEDVIENGDREALEIISDTADEVLNKAQARIIEARLAVSEFRGVSQ